MYRTTNRPNTRIEVADALRGIAVAGIILFHAREHFNLYWSALDLPRAGFGSWEQPVADMLGFLLSGKMYAIFALLFGLSFFIQSDNQAQRGNDFSLRFAWRMVLLFGIIPFKMKYLGWFELALWAVSFVMGDFATKISLVLGLSGFLAFYGREVFDWCRDALTSWKRRRDWENRNR